MKDKKVLIFSHEYPPCLGGAATVALTLYNGLKKIGYSTFVLTSKRSGLYKSNEVFVNKYPPQTWFLSYVFWLKLNHKKFDTIICNDPAAIYNAGKYFSDDILNKTICFIHGEEKYLHENKSWLQFIDFKNSFFRAINNSKSIIFVSDYIKQRYHEFYSLREKDNQFVIHSGINKSEKKTAFGELKIKSSSLDSPLKFLSVSRIVKEKGYDKMLAIFTHLSKENIKFTWSIVGDGSYLAEFKQKVALSSVSDKVKFYGAIDRNELPKVYMLHDYYILLSELNESYGLSYLEAASFGLIPIGYNRCGILEAFNYITQGLLLNINNDFSSLGDEILSYLKVAKGEDTKCLRFEEDFLMEVERHV